MGPMLGDFQNPYILSSSRTLHMDPRKSSGSMRQKRKTNARHQFIATITIKSGEKMVHTLRDMTQTNNELEAKRLVLHMQINEERMAYRRKWDTTNIEHKKLILLN